MSLYLHSYELYKAQSEFFNDDYDYYKNFCLGHKTLELFAGYGRLSNFLAREGVDIEIVELEKIFSPYIDLPDHKKHFVNVLDFNTDEYYERIIAGYNSFCLLIENEEISLFFNKIDKLLTKQGRASLSYFPLSSWIKHPPYEILYKNENMLYQANFDFSQMNKDIAIWIDEYTLAGKRYIFKYPTRVYRDENDLLAFTNQTHLKLVDIIKDYNKKNLSEPGWLEYVFEKI